MKINSVTFRVSTDILQRLGEELITSFDQGVVELVKNSYDADAIHCTIQLMDTDKLGGSVVITDDGEGMSYEDIRDGWLVLGRSRKVPQNRTGRGRLPAGSKGLGRLAALRMGDEVLLATRSCLEPGVEYSLEIRWPDFSDQDVVEDVELNIQQWASDEKPGTRIEIRRLRAAVGRREALRLARELVLLSDPFRDSGTAFKPELIAPEFRNLEKLVQRAYFDDCELRLVASLDENGNASAKVFDRSGVVRWVSGSEDFDSSYRAPKTDFELWLFLLTSDSFAGRTATIGEVREWIKQVGGVHLYHRGLRVRPYGDPGHDWLDMNLSRVRDPELRPSTNTSVGRVSILDEDQDLVEKTDRTGFVDNEAFREVRNFATAALEWMQNKRIQERAARTARKKLQTVGRITQAGATLRHAIVKLPPQERPAIENAARELESARQSEHDQLKDELGLYQTLASVGTAVSVFAHEIEGPAANLTVSLGAIERRAQRAFGKEYSDRIGPQIQSAKASVELIARFTTLPLRLLKRSKRRRAIIDVNKTLHDTVVLFEPYLSDARIETVCEFTQEELTIHGSIASVEAILSNFITNSVKAFRRGDADINLARRIIVRTNATEKDVIVAYFDNGPGITTKLIDRIWSPGVTSDENGTGLGLTIVRDTVTELNGNVRAIAKGELGGAEFVVQLPRSGVQS